LFSENARLTSILGMIYFIWQDGGFDFPKRSGSVKKTRIPYGISNFAMLREENYLYVDKTKYIEILENLPPYQFLIRPRRFGKSLFLSMLENYYDIHKKGQFMSLFGDLYIGQNPTPDQNNYLVLSLSFSSIVTSEGKERLIQSFDDNVISSVRSLVRICRDFLPEKDLPENVTGAEMAIRFITQTALEAGVKIFIMIDEYDNFANDLIGSGNKQLYQDLISGEGYVRSFYKAIKDGTTKSIKRVFMTGVSPIMLDDLTSGFNITANLTLEKSLNEMLGFTGEEVHGVIVELGLDLVFKEEELLKDLRKYYDGYRFCGEAGERLFNSDMVLYFLTALQENKQYPRNILDHNAKTDYRKLQELAFNFRDEETIDLLISRENIVTELVERFTLKEMYLRKENFISLSYYLGMLTIKGVKKNRYILSIPNYVVKTIYWEYFLDQLEKRHKLRIESAGFIINP
jgi:hypothetical protein